MPLYGTQTPPMPGQAAIGYGPSGQHYNQLNPVVNTTSGVRPASVAAVRVQPHNAAPGTVSRETQMMQANYRPPAWTQQGKVLAAQEQQRFGNDFYGNPAATPGSGTGAGGSGAGGGSNIGVSTGINATLPMDAAGAARQAMLRSAGVPLSGAQSGDLIDHYGGLTRALLSADNVDLARQGAFKEHQLQSQMEQARANAGIGWGDVGARFNALDIQEILGQNGLFNDRLRLASSLFN